MSELDKALLAAQKAVGVLVKDARNDFGKFDYTSAESVLIQGKAILNENGLFLRIAGETAHLVGTQEYVKTEYVLTHADSGEQITCARDWPVCPGGQMNPLRAAAATNTSGLSYLLRDLLQIPRVDKDDLNHAVHDSTPRGKQAPPRMSVADLKVACKEWVARLPEERREKATNFYQQQGDVADGLEHALKMIRSQVMETEK